MAALKSVVLKMLTKTSKRYKTEALKTDAEYHTEKKHQSPQPVSVAQLNARPTDDQEVAGLTPAASAPFFRGDLIMKYFIRSFSLFR